MKTINVRPVGKFKDGGTEIYKDKFGNEYYVDYRIRSTTKGAIYNGNPNKKGSKILKDTKLNIT